MIDIVLWGLSVILLGILVALSVVPEPPIGGPRPVDLILHVVAYAPTTLMLLLAGVWRPGRGEGPFPKLTVAFIAGVLVMGILLEVVQGLGWAGPREGEVADALANAVGVLAGLGAWSLLRRRG